MFNLSLAPPSPTIAVIAKYSSFITTSNLHILIVGLTIFRQNFTQIYTICFPNWFTVHTIYLNYESVIHAQGKINILQMFESKSQGLKSIKNQNISYNVQKHMKAVSSQPAFELDQNAMKVTIKFIAM